MKKLNKHQFKRIGSKPNFYWIDIGSTLWVLFSINTPNSLKNLKFSANRAFHSFLHKFAIEIIRNRSHKLFYELFDFICDGALKSPIEFEFFERFFCYCVIFIYYLATLMDSVKYCRANFDEIFEIIDFAEFKTLHQISLNIFVENFETFYGFEWKWIEWMVFNLNIICIILCYNWKDKTKFEYGIIRAFV